MRQGKISFSFKGAASTVGVSPSYLRKAVANGELKAIRLGGRVLIRDEDLREWFENNSRPYSKPEPQAA